MAAFCLYALIILCSGFCGMVKASVYSDRVTNLQDLIAGLKILESEIKYRLDPLPETFRRMGEYKKNRTSKFFAVVGIRLGGQVETGAVLDLEESWKQAVDEVFTASGLTEEDLFIIKDMAIELGKSGLAGQESMFERVGLRLAEQLEEALTDKKTKGKMYRSLGFAVGIVIVILLI